MRSSKTSVVDFTQLIVDRGIRDVIICPGSRNAPFIIEMSSRPEIRCHSVVDERSAAFIALGIARETSRPAVIVSTSGTAPLNFGPALAEAYYQKVSLIAVTADRPEEWIDHGEGQCIRQQDVFRNYVKKGVHIREDGGNVDLRRENLSLMADTVDVSMMYPLGPVHLNFPLAESLYIQEAVAAMPLPPYSQPAGEGSSDLADELVRDLSAAKKVVVLVGQAHHDPGLSESLIRLNHLPQVAVFTETHANVHDPHFVQTIDRWIMGAGARSALLSEAEIIITIGTNIISRKIKDLLRKSSAQHWHIDNGGHFPDTYRKLNRRITAIPSNVLTRLSAATSSDSDFALTVLDIERAVRSLASEVVSGCSYSDLTAFGSILPSIPPGYHVEMGNSSVVRYIQLFDQRADLTYDGNRGVSGIDGCTSTAVGVTFASERGCVLISGDVAFLYDSNAFWNDFDKKKLRIIVVNNGGGGIFRIIDGPNTTDGLEKFFETTHHRTAEPLANSFNIPYRPAKSGNELLTGLDWLFDQKDCSILEIFTPRIENDKVLKRYFELIRLN